MENEVLTLKDSSVPAELDADVNTGFVALESVTVVDSSDANSSGLTVDNKKNKKTVPASDRAQEANEQVWWKQQWFGTAAQWCAIVAMFVLFVLPRLFNHASEDFNLRVDRRIDGKLSQVIGKLDGITSRLDNFEGWRQGLEERFKLQLHGIKAKIQRAEASKVSLSPSELADYKNAVLASPSSSEEYWQTVATIINYQSLINQRSGKAPDPS